MNKSFERGPLLRGESIEEARWRLTAAYWMGSGDAVFEGGVEADLDELDRLEDESKASADTTS